LATRPCRSFVAVVECIDGRPLAGSGNPFADHALRSARHLRLSVDGRSPPHSDDRPVVRTLLAAPPAARRNVRPRGLRKPAARPTPESRRGREVRSHRNGGRAWHFLPVAALVPVAGRAASFDGSGCRFSLARRARPFRFREALGNGAPCGGQDIGRWTSPNWRRDKASSP